MLSRKGISNEDVARTKLNLMTVKFGNITEHHAHGQLACK